MLGYVKDYFVEVDKRIFFLSAAFIAVFIFCNYYFGINDRIFDLDEPYQYVSWYFVFLLAFSFGYFLLHLFSPGYNFSNRKFLFLFFIAPAIFSWKMVAGVSFNLANDSLQNIYWNQVIYWPLKLLVVTCLLFIIWKITRDQQAFYGIKTRDFNFKPYLFMLLIMVPVIAAASTQHDFLQMYPKLKDISFLKDENNGWHKLLYELSYGSDFFTIEIFFRGFLILAFVKWFGKNTILPMALFYCTIHFGKPLGECISSFFGGIILGVVVYHTRSIFGGLIVHLGIAWLMELGGYLGNKFFG